MTVRYFQDRTRLRIALVAPPWLPVPPHGYGGTERVIALLADGLAAAGHDVTLFAAAGSRTGARLVSPLEEPPPVIGAAPDEEAFHTLAAYLARDDFDLIHDHTSLGPAFAALLPDGPPVVHTLHGPWTPGLRHKLGLVHDRVHLVAISHAQQRLNASVRTANMRSGWMPDPGGQSGIPMPARGYVFTCRKVVSPRIGSMSAFVGIHMSVGTPTYSVLQGAPRLIVS